MRKNIFNKSLLVFTIDNSYFAIPASEAESMANQYRVSGKREASKPIHGYLNVRNIIFPVISWSTIVSYNKKNLYTKNNNYLILKYATAENVMRVAMPIDESLGIINSDEYIVLSPSLVLMGDLKITLINTYIEKENFRTHLENINTMANMFST